MSKMYLWSKEVKEVYLWSKKIWASDPSEAILAAINAENKTYLDTVVASWELMKILVSNTKCTDAFIAKNTLLQSYVSQMWNTVTTSSLFSMVWNTYWDDSWSNWVTNAATANSITFFSWWYYSSSSNTWWMKHRDWTYAVQYWKKWWQRPTNVTTSNVEWVSFVWATFWQNWDWYCAYATYKVA